MDSNFSSDLQPVKPILSAGCVSALAVAGLGIWTLILTIIHQTLMAILEQDLMLKIFPLYDTRWLIAIGYGLAVGAPGLLLWLFMRKSSVGQTARVFGLAGLLVILQAPGRTVQVQDSQLGLVFQLAGILVFILLIGYFEHLAGRVLPSPNLAGFGWAVALGGGLGLPWVALGALGSPLDTFLALAVGLGVGAAAVLILQPSLRQVEGESYGYSLFSLDGLVACAVLLPVVVSTGTNGSGTALASIVPLLGWAVAALNRSQSDRRSSNWIVPALLIGLALFWPLAFVDLEETSVLLSGVSEAGTWMALAVLLSIVLAVLIVVMAFILVQFWHAHPIARIAGGVLAGGAWITVALLYILVGKPGFYGERLFVILKDQADLSAARQIANPMERRNAVYKTLVNKADTTQAGLRATLTDIGIRFTPYYLVNAIEVQEEPLLRFLFLTRPEVDRVLIDTRLRPLPRIPISDRVSPESAPSTPNWNLKMIHAPQVWDELKITGKGIVIGQSDTGVALDHPELAGSFLKRGNGTNYSWFDPWYGSSVPTDYGGHGTHTLGSVLGEHVGVAPGAEWIGCVNLGRNLGNPALYLDCMQFHLAPFPQNGDPLHDGKPEFGANVLNNSWGCPPIEGCDPGALASAAKGLRAAGVYVVVSAGNDGEEGCETVADPLALYGEVTSIGAIDMDGNLASFSSLGPVTADGSGRMKPDLVAPGVDINSAYPGGGYTSLSGTSMAGPHVVGVVALMWSANPKLIGDIDRTEEILHRTAKPYTGALPTCVKNGTPNNAAGYGVVDAYAAVVEAMKVK